MAARRQIPCNIVIRDANEESLKLISAAPDFVVNLNNKGIRLSFLRDPNRETFSWCSADLAMTESSLHHITIELPRSRFSLTYRALTSDETTALSDHLPEDSSKYKIVDIDCRSSTTVTGFGLPFHGANETVDSWVNDHSPIQGVISLPDILHKQTFTLLVEASSTEITCVISSINAQCIPLDYGYGEE